MRLFSALFAELDASTATRAKVDALKRYIERAQPRDAAWAVYFLSGGKPRQVVPTALLRALACRVAGIDDWLFEASYQAVGDLAETIAHVLPPARATSDLGLRTGSRGGCCHCVRQPPMNRPSAWPATGTSSTPPAASC